MQINTTDEGKETFNFFFIYIYIYKHNTYILYASCIPKSKSNLFDSHEDGVLLLYDKSLTSSPTEDFSDIVSLHPPIVDFRVYRYQKLRHA